MLNAHAVGSTQAFLEQALGFVLADRTRIMAFMNCDADHHTLALGDTGYTVSPHYDSMLAKLIVHAPDRPRAIRRMRRVLSECVIEGISTNLPLHRWLLKQDAFVSGKYDTHFLEASLDPEAIRAEAFAADADADGLA